MASISCPESGLTAMRHTTVEMLRPPGIETLLSLKPTWRGRSHLGRLEHLVEEHEHVSTHNSFEEIGTNAIGPRCPRFAGKSLTNTLK